MNEDIDSLIARIARLEALVDAMAEGAGGGGAAAQPAMAVMTDNTPWVYVKNTGWYNCRAQMGYNKYMADEDITGREDNGDGTYYAECNLLEETIEVKKASSSSVPGNDFENHIVRFKIGEVENGEMKETIGCMPVLYKYV